MSRLLAGALVAAATATRASADCTSKIITGGSVPVTVDGVTTPWAIGVAGGVNTGTWVNPNGSMTMKHNDRGYLLNLGGTCPDAFSADLLTSSRLSLVGKVLNFTVDLSTVGCGCNAAFYMSSMPGNNASNQPDPTPGGDFYCDANDVETVWCPEMDVMEANNAALQITPHRCSAPVGWPPFYSSCDRSGCGVNTYRQCGAACFGPGPSFTINTLAPFTLSTNFSADPAGTLTSITTTLVQGTAAVQLSHTDTNCGAEYLEDVSRALADGMVVIFSVWGSDGKTMQWLDVPPCTLSQSCNADTASMTVSAISVG